MANSVIKVIAWIVGLITLFLILDNGGAFNNILKTATDSTIRGITVLQGRDGAATPA